MRVGNDTNGVNANPSIESVHNAVLSAEASAISGNASSNVLPPNIPSINSIPDKSLKNQLHYKILLFQSQKDEKQQEAENEILSLINQIKEKHLKPPNPNPSLSSQPRGK